MSSVAARLKRLPFSRFPFKLLVMGGLCLKRVTQSHWTEQVLHRGEIFRGSTREDIKAVFSEYEVSVRSAAKVC